MPDASSEYPRRYDYFHPQHRRARGGVHPPPFDYRHAVYLAAATASKDRSDGHCQLCGRKLPLEAHHWAKPYPPADLTTAADLTGLCRNCHIKQHLACFFENAGGTPESFCAALSETVATLLLRGATAMPRSPMRVGWAVRDAGRWAAFVTGESRPRIGEVFRLFLSTWDEWRTVVVTEILGGQPGCWRVRKRFLGADDAVADGACSLRTKPDGPCTHVAQVLDRPHGGLRRGVPRARVAGVGGNASDRRPAEGRSTCA